MRTSLKTLLYEKLQHPPFGVTFDLPQVELHTEHHPRELLCSHLAANS
jgi:hypothetical protein